MALNWGYNRGRQEAEHDMTALKNAALQQQKDSLEIRNAETELKQNEAFLNAISSGEVTAKAANEEEVPGVLETLGNLAIKTGNINKGKELLSASSTIANQEGLRKRREAKTRLENYQVLSNLYEGVTDQDTWNRANSQFRLITGQESPYAAQDFSVETLGEVKRAMTSAKDKAAVDLADARRELVGVQQRGAEARTRLTESQIALTKAREAAIKKDGGKPVPDAYITAVKSRLEQEFEDIGGVPGELRAIALPYAEKVWELVRDQGYDTSEAVEEIVQEAVDSGELAGWTPSTGFLPGSRRENAMPLPTKKDGKIDVDKLEKNKYYSVPGTGQTLVMTTKGKILLYEANEETPDDSDEGVDDPEDEGEGE